MNKNPSPDSKSITVLLQHQSSPENSQVQMRCHSNRYTCQPPHVGCEQVQAMWAVYLAPTATKSPLGYSLGLDSPALANDTEVRALLGSVHGDPLARAAGHHACPLSICSASAYSTASSCPESKGGNRKY